MFSGGSKGNIGKKRVKKIVTVFYGKYVSSRFLNKNGQTDHLKNLGQLKLKKLI